VSRSARSRHGSCASNAIAAARRRWPTRRIRSRFALPTTPAAQQLSHPGSRAFTLIVARHLECSSSSKPSNMTKLVEAQLVIAMTATPLSPGSNPRAGAPCPARWPYEAQPVPSAPAVSYPSTPSWSYPARCVDICSLVWRACWLVPTMCVTVWPIWRVNATEGTWLRIPAMSPASALRHFGLCCARAHREPSGQYASRKSSCSTAASATGVVSVR
jgi:hypothetical protein